MRHGTFAAMGFAVEPGHGGGRSGRSWKWWNSGHDIAKRRDAAASWGHKENEAMTRTVSHAATYQQAAVAHSCSCHYGYYYLTT
jgi:aromatic ring hydroxylase